MKKDKRILLGYAVAAVGIAMMLMGVADNQHREVFEKAVRICLECIGIG
ncbi:MAG: hypothetical protein IJN88_08865 [Clostridia bacterium]|nr:hypothetical protein [Clostridia bacterium]